MSQSDDERNNNAVGYGRPPVNRQFKPGQSGNPKGRPKGQKNPATILAEILRKKIRVSNRDGARRISKWEAMFEVLVNMALSGNLRAFNALFQMTEKLEVFKWQPPEVSAVSSREYIMQQLAKLGKLPLGYPLGNPHDDVDENQTT